MHCTKICSHQISWRGRFVSCVLRHVIQSACGTWLQTFQDPKDSQTVQRDDTLGFQGDRIGETWQCGHEMTHLYVLEQAQRPASIKHYFLQLPSLVNTVSLQPDASDFPTPGLLGPLKGFSFSSEIWEMGGLPVPGGH